MTKKMAIRIEIKKLVPFFIIFLIAGVITSIPVLASGFNPLKVYYYLLFGGFGSVAAIARTVNMTTPILFCALGILIAFRCAVWNIGAEGQLYMGALGAVIVGLFVRGIPMPLHLFLVFVASFIGGGLWGGIAGFLRVKYKANEIIVTLLMNFIASWFIFYIVHFPLKSDLGYNPVTARIVESAELPILVPGTSLHAGILIALMLAFVIWFGLSKTVLGYRIKAVGSNPEAAMQGGILLEKTIIVSIFLSGGMAGLAGMSEVSGVHYLLSEKLSLGYGFLAIPAAMLSRLNPLWTILSSLFLGGLLTGGRFVQVVLGIPSTLVNLIVAIFILAILLESYFEKKLASFF